MLAAYTYYCIVQRGGKGWKIWSMRRNAAKKVRSLPHATREEIEEKEDVCPICRSNFCVSYLITCFYSELNFEILLFI